MLPLFMVKKAARKRPSSHLFAHKKIKLDISVKTKKALQAGLIFLLLLFLLIFIKNAYFSIKRSIWDGRSQLVIAYEDNNQLGLVKFEPALHEAIQVAFPSDMYIPLALGYQSYRVNKVKDLAVLENIHLGNLLTASITQSIGILTDGYVTGLKNDEFGVKKMIRQSLFKPSSSNLTAWDKLRLLFFINSLRTGEIKNYKAEEEFLQTETLPDESEVFVINENLLTGFVLQELSNPEFLQERTTWELYNATNYDGLANSMRRIISNSGFDVSGIRQANEDRETSTLYISDWTKVNDNVKRFADFFQLPVVVDQNYTQRSDITLYLGEDYWEKYFTNQ